MNAANNIELNTARTHGILGDFLAFVVPCLIFFEIQMVGRLFVSELILLPVLLVLLFSRGSMLMSRLPRTFIMFGLIWLLSQVATDMIRSTTFEDYARGWSKIVFLLLNFSAIYLLLNNKRRRFMLFAVGIAVGQILQFFITPNIFALDGYIWKFGVGYAVTLLLIIGSQWRRLVRISFVSETICGAAAVLNLFLGYRSLGALCLVTALYMLYQRTSKSCKGAVRSVGSVKTVIGAIVLGSCAIVLVGALYGSAANAGWFGEDAKQKYEWQASGKLGFLVGGRPELLVSSMAIMDSPIIGHGSWAKDPRYSMLLLEKLSNYDYETGSERNNDLIPTHSYLLGAWVESGILGAIFWFWVLLVSVKLLIAMSRFRFRLSILLAFVAFGLIWNILFSPLGAEGRIYTAYYVVLLMYGTILVRTTQTVTPSTIIQGYS